MTVIEKVPHVFEHFKVRHKYCTSGLIFHGAVTLIVVVVGDIKSDTALGSLSAQDQLHSCLDGWLLTSGPVCGTFLFASCPFQKLPFRV